MSEPIDDGGPAFPGSIGYEGARLRDYFAVGALTGLLTGPQCDMDDDGIALSAYALADAMLAARKQTLSR